MRLIVVGRTRASSDSSKRLLIDLNRQCAVGYVSTTVSREAAANIGGSHAMRVAAGVGRQDLEQGHRQLAVGRQIALAAADDAFDRAGRRMVVVALNGSCADTFHTHVT